MILVLSAWVVRWAGRLYQVHREQAVIYRDRRAALGVIQVLLDATPDFEQRRVLLDRLHAGYLDFDQSAFRQASKHYVSDDMVDAKQLTKLAKALRPFAKLGSKALPK